MSGTACDQAAQQQPADADASAGADGQPGAPEVTELAALQQPGALAGALEAAADGHRVVVRAPSGRLVRLGPLSGGAGAADDGPDRAPLLSAREREVLGLVAQGMSGARIATELGLASNTVAQHLVSVRRKLGVHTSADAVHRARRSGQLPPA